jgi:hypothetical protein
VTDERIAYSDGLHNENTALLALDDRFLLVFRGGETGQVGSERAHLNVWSSPDGVAFAPLATVDAGDLPGGRDIRDPKLVPFGGRLFLYAISRLPGGHYRDLLGEAWTVRSESTDGGATWSPPEKTLEDVDQDGFETFWGMWRFTEHDGSLYAVGYDDGDTAVALFSSADGVAWEKRAIVIDGYDLVPSETELRFFGDTAVALVRLDDQGLLEDGQTAICTASPPYADWECGRRIEQRFDGPTWLSTDQGEFVVARKHLPCTFKRTAVYELRGDLADPSADVRVCEVEELPSAGDTAYTALAPLGGDRWLLSWYSSTIPASGDVPWLEGMYTPSDIWLATLDLGEAPDACHPPPEDAGCPAVDVPEGDPSALRSGAYVAAIAPVIWPEQTLSFAATVTATAGALDLALQPLDAVTGDPVGAPWTASATVGADGRFTAAFPVVSVPEETFPLLADPFLTLHDLVLDGVVTVDGLCGAVDGVAQVLGVSPSDAIHLSGSTFGLVPVGSDPVASCR